MTQNPGDAVMMPVFTPLADLRVRRSGQAAGTVPYLLVNPPLTDPTAPYHSIPYLVGAARAAGHGDYRCLDANIEALEFLARPEWCRAALDRARQTRLRVEAGGDRVRTRLEEIRYRQALSVEGMTAESAGEAVAVLRDPALFYDLPTYRQAAAALLRWFGLLALDMAPGVMDGFTLRLKSAANLCSTDDLADDEVIDAVCGPFSDYFEAGFAEALRERDWAVVGFSVNYHSQLPFALRMARQVRELLPEAVIVFGGTETGDIVKYTTSADGLWRVFRDADLIVPGEGESAFIGILDAARDGVGFEGIRGVSVRPEARTARGNGGLFDAIVYEHVGNLPAPAYDVWDWDRYWSPEPVVLYSPTRGCYWNKCTFCDYGLNSDRPTSPSRERPVDRVLADLAAVADIGRTLYFAVDAMSPRYLRQLADALADSPLAFRWSAELRLERTFPQRSMGKTLAAAGCIAAAFGYESGSQRILDLIDKGVRIANVPDVLADLAANGIGVQMMGFTGFPGETEAEAHETFRFLHRHDELWTSAGVGRFTLTPGSIVAKAPERFGIGILPSAESDDIPRSIPWTDTASGAEVWPEDRDDRITPEERGWLRRGAFGRLFVGGIDTAHTLLYFARYGRRLLPADGGEPAVALIGDRAVTVPFAALDDLTGVEDLEAEVARRARAGIGTTAATMRHWLAGAGSARPGRSAALLRANGSSVTLPPTLDLEPGTALTEAFAALFAVEV